jgi:heavy-metal-associated domain-containing protein
MARDDKSASDVPVEGVSNRSFAPALDAPLAATHVIHSIPGRVRLRVPLLKARPHLSRGLEALLVTQTGITEATVNKGCHSVTVAYDPAVWTSESLCMFLQSRSREEIDQWASVALTEDVTDPSPINWLQPWRFLNTTAGSSGSEGAVQTGESVKSGYWRLGYASMVVGAVLVPVPLVPGIPFLILSSYFFAKATVLKDKDGPAAGERVPKAKE